MGDDADFLLKMIGECSLASFRVGSANEKPGGRGMKTALSQEAEIYSRLFKHLKGRRPTPAELETLLNR